MLSRRKLFILPVLLTSLLALTACPSQTSISKLKADPDRYMDKEVGIVGRVTDSYGIPFVGGETTRGKSTRAKDAPDRRRRLRA